MEDRQVAPLTVLVAEDNEINQRLISAILSDCGHRFVIVGAGEETVRAVQDQNFDVVLMDIHMPNLNGLEAARKIREMPESVRYLPIITVTANAMNADRQEHLRRGLTGFVPKAIDPDKLISEMKEALLEQRPDSISLASDTFEAAGGDAGAGDIDDKEKRTPRAAALISNN